VILARVSAMGRVTWQDRDYRAALGRTGISGTKVEGDGTTPAGWLPLRKVLYRADRVGIPRAAVPREPIGPADGWCDDPGHPDYNKMVGLPHPAHREELWRSDSIYDVIGVLGWNDAPAVRGRGSAIFAHVARGDYSPTEGCIALALPDLLALLSAGLTGFQVDG
jgi:L,D-peptidoglycan transpeptidase YkuD (ErfK/YbiS/YcfS/YnhG family)